MFKNVSVRGRCINVEERLSVEGKIVKYSSVSLSLTLSKSKNKKIEQYIRNKTQKFNVFGCVWI